VEDIKQSDLDPTFKYDISERPGGECFKRCFACGTCTAVCPVSEVDSVYNPRRIIRQALLGMRKEVLSSRTIWYCLTCYRCTVKCPQNVHFTDLMDVLRRMAVEAGYAPEGIIADMEEINRISTELRHRLAIEYLQNPQSYEKTKTELKKLIPVKDGEALDKR
jgi:heterodisulfide reductase subunit C2